MVSPEEYNKEKDVARLYYEKIKSVFSPALNATVHFNSEGFNHLIYRTKREERDKASQVLRFKLLPLVADLVRLSTTYQEYEEVMQEVVGQKYGKCVKENKLVFFWGIIAIINGRKIKVVLKKVGNGQIIFWSVIPEWNTSKYRDMRFFHSMEGNPQTD